ncbi:hypothetical protein RDABS01_000167 [Bienertia sinuspersici]
MADDLIKKCAQLTLTNEEDEIVEFDMSNDQNLDNKVNLSLVGKIKTPRPYNFNAFKNTMNQVWSLSRKALFREIENNMFIIQFFHWRDKEKVLNGRPWCFDQHLILLQELDPSIQPSDIELVNCPFWVRIYNLPFDYRTKEHAVTLASRIGEVLEVEDDIIGWDKSMRVRVMLNTCKPLRRMQKIKNKKGETCWVEFKYERLPFFSYKCGVMGHTERDCQEEECEGEEKGRQWGAWLKASPRKGIASREEEIQQLNKTKKALVFHTKQNRKRGEEYGAEGRKEKSGGSNSEVRRLGNDERFDERSGDWNVSPGSETQISKASSSEHDSSNLVDINSEGTGNGERPGRKWKRIPTHRVLLTREQAKDDDIDRKRKGVVDMEIDQSEKKIKNAEEVAGSTNRALGLP